MNSVWHIATRSHNRISNKVAEIPVPLWPGIAQLVTALNKVSSRVVTKIHMFDGSAP